MQFGFSGYCGFSFLYAIACFLDFFSLIFSFVAASFARAAYEVALLVDFKFKLMSKAAFFI